MNLFVARQPIFDLHNEVFGYEILYRSNSTFNAYWCIDGDLASLRTITSTFFNFGISRLTSGKKAFINFTENLLERGVATLFPKEYVVLEVLEDVTPSTGVLKALTDLKELGYTIALDDFVFDPDYSPLIELADIIKVDFLTTSPRRLKEITRILPRNIRFLAERVETREDFEKAKQLGYSLFQGYYFSKPVIIKGRKMEPKKDIYLQLLKDLNQPDLDFQTIAALIERDVTLTYEILRIVNSAIYFRNSRVKSVWQALVFLGKEELKKWAYIISLTKMGVDQPAEVVTQSLLRAKFLETLAFRSGLGEASSEFFLMGLVSMLDVLLERPLEEVLNELAISEEVRGALLGRKGVYSGIFDLMRFYESGQWDLVAPLSYGVRLEKGDVAECYLEALKWLDFYFNSAGMDF